MMDDREYVARYNELYAHIVRAYKDYYYLQTMGDIDTRYGFEDVAIEPLNHICELLKTDLCLLIWKMCIDTASDANTLRSLKNAVFVQYGKGSNGKYFHNIDSKTEEIISVMRSHAIAHNLVRGEIEKVSIDSLGRYLFEGIRLLNDICCQDKGVHPFDNIQMLRTRLNSEGGFRWLLEKEVVKKQEGKYRVITLCGSTRFKDAFMEAQKRLTLEGNIVISVGLFGHSGDEEVWAPGTKEMLDDMHKRKIDMADEIFVINVGGYIGSSTRSEIEYAISTGKMVNYLVKA